jgi:hypothetical protein
MSKVTCQKSAVIGLIDEQSVIPPPTASGFA